MNRAVCITARWLRPRPSFVGGAVFCLVGVRLVLVDRKRECAFKAVGALRPTAFFIYLVGLGCGR